MNINNPYHGGSPGRYGFGTGAGGGGGGAVDSVFGRVGVVVAASGDYGSTLITNNSTVPGATVTNALDNLAAAIPPTAPVDSVFGRVGAVVAVAGDYDANQIDYDNAVSGLTSTEVQGAIDELAQAQTLVLSGGGGAPSIPSWPAAGGGGSASGTIPMIFGGDENIQTNDVCPPPAGIGQWISTKNMGYYTGDLGIVDVVGVAVLIRNYITNVANGSVTFRVVHYPADGTAIANFNAGSAGQTTIAEVTVNLPNTSGNNRFYFGSSGFLPTRYTVPANHMVFVYVSDRQNIQTIDGYVVNVVTEFPISI